VQGHSAEGLIAELGLRPFRPRKPWLCGDLQTLRDTLRPVVLPPDAGEPIRIDLGQGDQLLALLDRPLLEAEPLGLVLLLHGLAGGSEREGLRRMGHTLQRAGFAVLRLNMRGAGLGRALARGTYAAQSNRDLWPALSRARALAGELAPAGRPLLGMGISLGGTMLLNAVLAADAERPALDGLVCISSPLDLLACSTQIARPRNRVYERWLLQRLVAQTLADPFGVTALERAVLEGQGPGGPLTSIRAFDGAITAPRWGYGSVEDYYRQASPLPTLLADGPLRLPPTLIVHADDDPWVPSEAAHRLAAAALPGVEVLITAQGGHNGFHARCDGPGGRDGCWGDRLTARWLRRLVEAQPPV